MRLIIVSGRSGSGKSVLLHHLEDLGYYAVDNLPFVLLPELLSTLSRRDQIAVSLDSRNMPDDPELINRLIHSVRDHEKLVDLIYLDADDETLLKRYSETRRKHPLSSKTLSLREAIAQERDLLTPIANRADLLIDTRSLRAHDLMNVLRSRILLHEANTLSLLFESFGYKRGIPTDADYVFDVRTLPNPYWDPELRALTGLDEEVIRYFSQQPAVEKMEKAIESFLEQFIPEFERDRRSYLTVAIGCTGGNHRSVYLVERLAAYFKKQYPHLQVRHRELTP